MASDDEDERLAHFLESDLLSEVSDQEESETVEKADETKGRHNVKRQHVPRDGLSEDEEKEQQEAKKIRIEAGEISDEGLSWALKSCSSSSLSSTELETEVVVACTHAEKSDIAVANNNNSGKRSTESRQAPRRIETGIFSHIPHELLYHILKSLSSEVLVSCSLVCRFLNFITADESLWRRLYCMRWGLLPPKKLLEEALHSA